MSKFPCRTIALTIVASLTCALAQAQTDSANQRQGITVSGVGIVKKRPNLATVELKIDGKAEITEDALVKYRDNRRRLMEALEKLKLENMKISERDVTLNCSAGGASNMMAMMNGDTSTDDSSPTEISGRIRVELQNLENIPSEDILKSVGKVLDAVRDAGLALGPSAAEVQMARRYGYGMMSQGLTVRFVLKDFQDSREKAYELAVEDARTRSTRLAKLNRIKLLGVSAIQETRVDGETSSNNNSYPWWWEMNNPSSSVERGEIVADNLAEIPITVQLMVRFDTGGPEPEPTAGASK